MATITATPTLTAYVTPTGDYYFLIDDQPRFVCPCGAAADTDATEFDGEQDKAVHRCYTCASDI